MELHFFPLLTPRRSSTLPPTMLVPVLLKESAPLEVVEAVTEIFEPSFSLIDYDLNKFMPVPPRLTPVLPKSSTLLCLSKGLTDSKLVMANEFLTGKLTFLREFGLTLMSGRNDYVDFCMGSIVFSDISTFSFLARNLLRSKPPPVISSFLALLSSSACCFISSCSRMYFLKAYSARLCVSRRRSSSSFSFLNFSSSNLCRSISAFLFLSSSLSSFSLLFLSDSSR